MELEADSAVVTTEEESVAASLEAAAELAVDTTEAEATGRLTKTSAPNRTTSATPLKAPTVPALARRSPTVAAASRESTLSTRLRAPRGRSSTPPTLAASAPPWRPTSLAPPMRAPPMWLSCRLNRILPSFRPGTPLPEQAATAVAADTEVPADTEVDTAVLEVPTVAEDMEDTVLAEASAVSEGEDSVAALVDSAAESEDSAAEPDPWPFRPSRSTTLEELAVLVDSEELVDTAAQEDSGLEPALTAAVEDLGSTVAELAAAAGSGEEADCVVCAGLGVCA